MPNAEPEIGQSILRAEPHPVGHQPELPRGQCTVLLGRNGVGKTTLVNCIMGHVPVVSGSMTRAAGGSAAAKPVAAADGAPRRAGHQPRARGRQLFSQLSVEENLQVAQMAGRGALAAFRR